MKNIAILDLGDPNNVTQTLQSRFNNQNVVFIKTDVSKKEQVQSAFAEVISKFNFVDIVFANAGILRENDYEQTFNVNVVRTFIELVSCSISFRTYINSSDFFTQLTLQSTS